MRPSTPCPDGTRFGPASTYRLLDFTPLFENTILVFLPTATFLAFFFAFRLPPLLRRKQPLAKRFTIANNRDWIGPNQTTFAAVDAIVSVVLMVLICAEPSVNTAVATAALGGWSRIATHVAQCVASFTLLIAAVLEPQRTKGSNWTEGAPVLRQLWNCFGLGKFDHAIWSCMLIRGCY